MIELKNVSFSYQGQDHGGLHNVTLNIKQGECVLICGRSGCGKTTITRLINGLIPYFYPGEFTGDVLMGGQVIPDMPSYSEFVPGKTVIAVAHRLSALKMCDRVAVVENHTITCVGTHEEVRQQNDYYRTSWADYEAARSISCRLEGGENHVG